MLRQVHSNKVFDMDTIVEQDFLDTTPDLPVADSSITSKVCQCSVVVTADCLPILVSSQEGALIGSIHCGWKGLSNKIISVFFESFFNKLYRLKKPIGNSVYVWLGPCISQEFYAVGRELEQFTRSKLNIKLHLRCLKNKFSWTSDI